MRRSPGLRGSARRSSFISGASKCKPGTKQIAVVRVRKIKSLAFHLPFSGQLAIGEELTDGQELAENSGSFGGGRKRDRTSDLGLVRAALSQLSYPPVLGFSRTCGCASTTETPDVPENVPVSLRATSWRSPGLVRPKSCRCIPVDAGRLAAVAHAFQ